MVSLHNGKASFPVYDSNAIRIAAQESQISIIPGSKSTKDSNESPPSQPGSLSRWKLPHYIKHHKGKSSVRNSNDSLGRPVSFTDANSTSSTRSSNSSNNAIDDLADSLLTFNESLKQSSINEGQVMGTDENSRSNEKSPSDNNSNSSQHNHHHHHHHRASRMLGLFKSKHTELESPELPQSLNDTQEAPPKTSTKRSYSARILKYATGNSSKNKTHSATTSSTSSKGNNLSPVYVENHDSIKMVPAMGNTIVINDNEITGVFMSPSSHSGSAISIDRVRTFDNSPGISPVINSSEYFPSYTDQDRHFIGGGPLKRSKSYSTSEHTLSPYSPYNKSFNGHDFVSHQGSVLSASYSNLAESESNCNSPMVNRFSHMLSTGTFVNTTSTKKNTYQVAPEEKLSRVKRSNTLGDSALKQQQQMQRGRDPSIGNTHATARTDDVDQVWESQGKNDENDASVAFNKVFRSASNSQSNLHLSSQEGTYQFLDSLPTPHTSTTTPTGASISRSNSATNNKAYYISRRKRTNTCGSTSSRNSVSTVASSVFRHSPIRSSTSPKRQNSLSLGSLSLHSGILPQKTNFIHHNPQIQSHSDSISSGSSSVMSSVVKNVSSSTAITHQQTTVIVPVMKSFKNANGGFMSDLNREQPNALSLEGTFKQSEFLNPDDLQMLLEMRSDELDDLNVSISKGETITLGNNDYPKQPLSASTITTPSVPFQQEATFAAATSTTFENDSDFTKMFFALEESQSPSINITRASESNNDMMILQDIDLHIMSDPMKNYDEFEYLSELAMDSISNTGDNKSDGAPSMYCDEDEYDDDRIVPHTKLELFDEQYFLSDDFGSHD